MSVIWQVHHNSFLGPVEPVSLNMIYKPKNAAVRAVQHSNLYFFEYQTYATLSSTPSYHSQIVYAIMTAVQH